MPVAAWFLLYHTFPRLPACTFGFFLVACSFRILPLRTKRRSTHARLELFSSLSRALLWDLFLNHYPHSYSIPHPHSPFLPASDYPFLTIQDYSGFRHDYLTHAHAALHCACSQAYSWRRRKEEEWRRQLYGFMSIRCGQW